MKRLNILMAIDSFNARSGASTTFYEHAKGLAERGNNVSLIFRTKNAQEACANFPVGIKLHPFNNNIGNSLLFTISDIFKTFKIFKKIRAASMPDVINVHHSLSCLGINISRKTSDIPRVYLFQSPWCTEYKLNLDLPQGNAGTMAGARPWHKLNFYARKWLEKYVLDRSQKIIVLSQFMKEILIEVHKIPESRVVVLPGGVDTSRFRPYTQKRSLRKQLGIPEDKFVLLTVRRLVPRMGLQNLIKAISKIIDEVPDIYLIIVGDGIMRKKLFCLVEELRLQKHIFFTGSIPPLDEKLVFYYQSADLFILPTKYLEGFGLVTLEALACGTPVLGTPVGGTKEILSGLDENLLFKGTDADSMAELILEYANSRHKFEDIKPRCRQYAVENYSWSVIIPKVEEVFLNACK